MSDDKRINGVAWTCWFAGAALMPLVSRNPLYLAICLLAVLFVHLSWDSDGSSASAWRLFAYVGASVALLSIGFNVLTVHVGDRGFARLPDALPIIGGRLTLNALVYGMASALAISTLLLAAATFNAAVRHADLLRLMPQRLARLGIAGTIALTFVPQMVSAARDIHEAQRARGHRYRRPSDATALLAPLLATGMERAITFSEALEVRGFGASAKSARSLGWPKALGGVALSLALLMMIFFLGAGQVGASAMILVLVVSAIFLTGRRNSGTIRRTRYRPVRWNAASVVLGGAAIGPIASVTLHFGGIVDLAYEPFPRLAAPEFNVAIGVLIAFLVLPALLRIRGAWS